MKQRFVVAVTTPGLRYLVLKRRAEQDQFEWTENLHDQHEFESKVQAIAELDRHLHDAECGGGRPRPYPLFAEAELAAEETALAAHERWERGRRLMLQMKLAD